MSFPGVVGFDASGQHLHRPVEVEAVEHVGNPDLVLAFARVIEMRATSELEKNAEKTIQSMKRKISIAFSIIVFHNVRVHAYNFD